MVYKPAKTKRVSKSERKHRRRLKQAARKAAITTAQLNDSR